MNIQTATFMLLAAFLMIIAKVNAISKEQAAVGEVFVYKIDSMHFNWTTHVMNEQFRYRASLKSYPDLPSWMRYRYSHEHHTGFLYGTPPVNLAGKTIQLDVVALNKENYETRHLTLSIFVAQKFPTPNVVQMKIDNLNWVHFMDPGRVEDLRSIFRKELWPESENDLSLVFIESAVNMGGRLPLQPQQREGVIVHLGSFTRFSARLKELQEEVNPLYKLRRVQGTCPYKRTSVQKIFENAGFKLDWCSFKISGADISPEVLYHNHANKNQNNLENFARKSNRWQEQKNLTMMYHEDVPVRNYIDEFAFAFAIPGVIFAIFLGILSFVLCYEHEKLHDPTSQFFFNNIFHICEEFWYESSENSQRADDDYNDDDSGNSNEESSNGIANSHNTSTVHMVQYADDGNSQPVTTSTLKSLKDPNNFLDNISPHSQSPNSSSLKTGNNSCMRPKPPSYKGSTLSRNSAGNISQTSPRVLYC